MTNNFTLILQQKKWQNRKTALPKVIFIVYSGYSSVLVTAIPSSSSCAASTGAGHSVISSLAF